MPPSEVKGRPLAGPALNTDSTAAKSRTILAPSADLTNAAVIACREWSYRFVRKCSTPVPRFGSPEWLALDEGSPEKVAATTVAAVAWLVDCVNAPTNLALEIEERRRADKEHADAEYRARAAEHRRQWCHLRLVADWRTEPKTPRPLEDIAADYMRAGRQGGGRDAG